MTYERCQAILNELRRQQGTERPLVQVTCGKSVVRGRVNYSASGLAPRRNPNSPYGVLVLEQMGLARAPSSFVQIANIPDDGLLGIEPVDCSGPPAQEPLADLQAAGQPSKVGA